MQIKKMFLPFIIIVFISGGLYAQKISLKSLRSSAKKNNPTTTISNIGFSATTVKAYSDNNKVKKASDTMSKADKAAFLNKNIPSVIGSSGMAPAFFDNFNVSFGDDKLSITTGTFADSLKKNSIGATISAEAPNGSRTIFQPGGKTPYDFGVELKYTYEMKASKWRLKIKDRVTDTISSISNKWINFSFSGNIAKHILFTDDTLNNTKNPFTFEALISFNYLFNSFIINEYVRRRVLYSIGAGFGRYTNYDEQDEVNLRKGTIYNNNQLSETEVISGRRAANYKIVNGLIAKASIFKPLSDPFSYNHIHFGATISSFGLGSSNHLLNGTGGIYYSRWKSEEDEEKEGEKILKEIFSVGLIADFRNLQNSKQSAYMKDNFKLVLSAQIPLNFF
jgi:hypothetical protein